MLRMSISVGGHWISEGSLFTLKHTFHAFAAKNMVSRPLMSHGHFQTRTLPKTLIIPSLGWAKYLSRSAISKYMRIDWRTVGRCIARVHEDLEPDVNVRLDGAVKIGIDETSYRKGHSYITVVVNHETNTVIWAAKDHGKSVLQSSANSLLRSSVHPLKW